MAAMWRWIFSSDKKTHFNITSVTYNFNPWPCDVNPCSWNWAAGILSVARLKAKGSHSVTIFSLHNAIIGIIVVATEQRTFLSFSHPKVTRREFATHSLHKSHLSAIRQVVPAVFTHSPMVFFKYSTKPLTSRKDLCFNLLDVLWLVLELIQSLDSSLTQLPV